MNEDRFKKAEKRLFIIRQAPVFIILFIIGKDKEINNFSHPLTSISELIKCDAKTPLKRSRGEKLYKG
jgi:hypothetical protein